MAQEGTLMNNSDIITGFVVLTLLVMVIWLSLMKREIENIEQRIQVIERVK
jgi:hypothetical protein